jgi:hypothetical protein
MNFYRHKFENIPENLFLEIVINKFMHGFKIPHDLLNFVVLF